MQNNSFVTIIAMLLLLVSCTYPHIDYPLVSPDSINQLIPMQMKINNIDWYPIFYPIVQKIQMIDGINDGSALLITRVKNNTNGYIPVDQATSTLTRIIINLSHFKVISPHALHSACHRLGIVLDDRVELLSKSIGLARYLNADYILYSIAKGDVKNPYLHLTLMSVKTGEILWIETIWFQT